MVQSHKDLDVWKKAMLLAERIYDVTELFPKHQTFALAQQLQRAAISVVSNIAEGSARGSRKEFVHFLHIARGSLAEVDTQLFLAQQRRYIQEIDYTEISCLSSDVGRMLTRLIQSLKKYDPRPANHDPR